VSETPTGASPPAEPDAAYLPPEPADRIGGDSNLVPGDGTESLHAAKPPAADDLPAAEALAETLVGEDSEVESPAADAAMLAALELDVGADLPPRESREAPSPEAPDSFRGIDLPDFDETSADLEARRLSLLHDVDLKVCIELGRTWMLVEDVLKLGEGSVVELDKAAGDPVDVFVNDRLIARGEVLVLNDSFCVRISEVLAHDPHRVSV